MFTACGIMHRRSSLLVTLSPAGTTAQSIAPDDGRNYRPKHAEVIEITNKLLLLRLVGCLYYCIRDARSHKHKIWQPYVYRL